MKYKYKPYPSYKDSWLEWLGDVPEHWDTSRLKFLCDITTGGKDTENKVDDGQYPFYVRSQTVERINSYSYNGEAILTAGDGVGVGKVFHYTTGKFDFHQRVYMFYHFKRVAGRFLFEYIKNNFYKVALAGVAKSTVDSLRLPLIQNFMITVPPLQEQQAIVNYLDSATAKIDILIEKQTKLIALLKEKRQAVISTAVTRGLDNTVAMKDSEVEWLGEIPAHWEVKKLKFIAYAKPSNVDKKSKDGEKDVLLCNYTDVYYNDFITNDIEFMKATATNEQIKKFTLNVDDVIITKDSEGPEDIAIATCVKEVQDNLVCGYHLTHIKPTKCNGRYLFRAFNSDGIHDQFKVAANGITRYGIGVYGIDNSFFPAPPMKEQEEIANYIDDKTSKIDTLISKASKAIELLKERRTALISAVVTGKIDVREINMESA